MKLTRLLLLVPAAGLLMTGCDKKAPEPTVDSIAVSGVYKTAYAVEEEFEKTGIVVTATYSDGSKKDVSASASFSGFSSAEAGSSTVTVSAEGKSTSFSVEVKAGYEFKDAKAMFAKAEIEGVLVPSYFGENLQPTEFSGMIMVTTTAEEFAAYKASVAALGWAPEDAGEEAEEGVYSFKYGETSYCTLVDGVEDYGMAAIAFEQDYLEFDSFPADRVARYFAREGIEGVNVPAFQAAGEGAYFDLDVSKDGYFDIYACITTSEELVAYKNLLKENGWVVVSPADPEEEATAEDFRLRYGETYAYVDLLDYTSYEDPEDGTPAYNLISFYTKFPVVLPEIVEAINVSLSAATGEEVNYEYNSVYNTYTFDLTLASGEDYQNSQAEESVIKPAADALLVFIPTSLGEGSYHFYTSEEDWWEDGSGDTVASYYFEGEGYDVEVVGYAYNGHLNGKIIVSMAA